MEALERAETKRVAEIEAQDIDVEIRRAEIELKAGGGDTAFNGGSGELMITQASTFSAPYYVSGQATMTFTPG